MPAARLLCLLFLFLLPACDYSYLEFDKYPGYTHRPTILIPLASSTLSMEDVVLKGDHEEIRYDEQDMVIFVYKGAWESPYAEDFFLLPSLQFSRNIPLEEGKLTEVLSHTSSVLFPVSPSVISSMKLKGGALKISVSPSSNLPQDSSLEVIFQIPGATHENGNPLELTLRPGNPVTLQLDGYTIPFLDDNLLEISYQVSQIPSGAGSPHSLIIDHTMTDLAFSVLHGELALPQALLSPHLHFGIGMFRNHVEGHLYFEEPSFHLMAGSTFGIPLSVGLPYLTFATMEEAVQLQGWPNPWPVQGAGSYPLQEAMSNNLVLHRDNSNIRDVVNAQPRSLSYQFALNNRDEQLQAGFIADTSRLDARMELRLPARGRVDHFTLVDTVDFSPGSLEGIDIEFAELNLNMVNWLPVDAFLRLEFRDQQGNILLDLLEEDPDYLIAHAAEMDHQGVVRTPRNTNTRIPLSDDDLQKILDSRWILVRGRMLSVDEGSTIIQIYADYTLSISLGAKVIPKTEIGF
jgi:hypothetical protein